MELVVVQMVNEVLEVKPLNIVSIYFKYLLFITNDLYYLLLATVVPLGIYFHFLIFLTLTFFPQLPSLFRTDASSFFQKFSRFQPATS